MRLQFCNTDKDIITNEYTLTIKELHILCTTHTRNLLFSFHEEPAVIGVSTSLLKYVANLL